MFENYPKFCDFEDGQILKGEKVKISDILGQQILITNFKKDKSRIKADETYIKIQFISGYTENDEPIYKVVNTSSSILDKQLTKHKQKLPFVATIIQNNKYLTLT